MISNKHVVLDGKASFYACILPDIKKAARECGWAIGVHGSLQHDLDLMAMAWTEEATTPEVLMNAIRNCFVDNRNMPIAYYDKPNNRVVYTISIFADWYLDINFIKSNYEKGVKE